MALFNFYFFSPENSYYIGVIKITIELVKIILPPILTVLLGYCITLRLNNKYRFLQYASPYLNHKIIALLDLYDLVQKSYIDSGITNYLASSGKTIEKSNEIRDIVNTFRKKRFRIQVYLDEVGKELLDDYYLSLQYACDYILSDTPGMKFTAPTNECIKAQIKGNKVASQKKEDWLSDLLLFDPTASVKRNLAINLNAIHRVLLDELENKIHPDYIQKID